LSRHTTDGLSTVTGLGLARGDLLNPAEAISRWDPSRWPKPAPR
jgi:hypothetical protein